MLKKLADFANKREMRESRDEMVVGEVELTELNDLAGDDPQARANLGQLLHTTLDELRGQLAPYKKASPFEIDG